MQRLRAGMYDATIATAIKTIAAIAKVDGSRGKLAIRTDCRSQMVRFGQGFVLEVWLAGSQRLEAVIRNGEHIVSRGTYDVSPDRRTLSFITQATHIVFDRVGAR